jgi:hypothetical protein
LQSLLADEQLKKRTSQRKANRSDDSTNDNNVYVPRTENQASKCKKQVYEGKSNVSREDTTRNALTLASNEKSHDDADVDDKKKVKDSRAVSRESTSAQYLKAIGKFVGYQEKICQYLDYLRLIINDPPQLIDINDLNIRRRRSSEFTNRFSRNHLYQIGRLVSKL